MTSSDGSGGMRWTTVATVVAIREMRQEEVQETNTFGKRPRSPKVNRPRLDFPT